MSNYKKVYFRLFSAVSQVINLLEKASLETEEIYIAEKDEKCELIDFNYINSVNDDD